MRVWGFGDLCLEFGFGFDFDFNFGLVMVYKLKLALLGGQKIFKGKLCSTFWTKLLGYPDQQH